MTIKMVLGTNKDVITKTILQAWRESYEKMKKDYADKYPYVQQVLNDVCEFDLRDELRDCIYTCDNMAHMAELLNDIDAEMFVAQHYFVALDWYDTVKSKAAAVRHVVSDHEHLDDDTKLAEWYDKVVDNEICYHLDAALSDTWFTVVDAFTYTALCYVLELVHEAICDGREM